jgi:hypothetical protein
MLLHSHFALLDASWLGISLAWHGVLERELTKVLGHHHQLGSLFS